MNTLPGLSPGLAASAAQNFTKNAPANQKPGSNHPDRKLMEECRQFEGILIANLWNEMEKGISLSGPGSDPGSGTMQGFGIEAAAMAIAHGGGLGIARMLYQELAPRLQKGQPSSAAAEGVMRQ